MSVSKIDLTYFEGIEIYPKETQITIEIDDINECISIMPKNINNTIIHIKFEKLIDCASVHEELITEKNKSVIGRAIVGGVLTGGLGAVVGGMSGIGNKKKVKKIHYLKIDYKSKDNKAKEIMFRMDSLVFLGDFVSLLKDRINKHRNTNTEKEIYL